MKPCDGCGIMFQPRNSRHRFHSSECRKAGPGNRIFRPNRAALETQIQAMATGPEHRALIHSCRALADVLDAQAETAKFDDKAWREYRLALKGLREAVDDGGTPDPLSDWISASRGEIRDTENTRT